LLPSFFNFATSLAFFNQSINQHHHHHHVWWLWRRPFGERQPVQPIEPTFLTEHAYWQHAEDAAGLASDEETRHCASADTNAWAKAPSLGVQCR
jgi:hypothetical protein